MKILQYVRLHIKKVPRKLRGIFHFFSYAHFKYPECLFTKIQKQQNTLKSSLRFKKNTNFTGE